MAVTKNISLKEFNAMVRDLGLTPEQSQKLKTNFKIIETVITCELKTGVSKKGNNYAVLQFKKNGKFVMNPLMDSDCIAWLSSHGEELKRHSATIDTYYNDQELNEVA